MTGTAAGEAGSTGTAPNATGAAACAVTRAAGPVADQPVAPERPFDEPWQARAFALAVVTVERMGLPWDAFRHRLKAAVAAEPARPYWESWLAALEDLAHAV